MIKINKRPLLGGTVIKTENDYRSGVVFQMIVEDCRSKCYLCEDLDFTSPRVEHRIPHGGAPELKFDWNNISTFAHHNRASDSIKAQ